MWGVLRKDMWRYALAAAMYIALTAVFWFSTRDYLVTPMATLNGIGLYFALLAPAVIVEANEEKYKGYEILASLPLRIGEIVTAKHLAHVCVIALLLAYNIVLFSIMDDPRGVISACRMTILTHALFALLAVGLMYIIIYRFGIMTFTVGVTALGVVANGLFAWLGSRAYKDPRLGPRIFDGFMAIPWYAVVVIVIVVPIVFYLLMKVSIGLKAARLTR